MNESWGEPGRGERVRKAAILVKESSYRGGLDAKSSPQKGAFLAKMVRRITPKA